MDLVVASCRWPDDLDRHKRVAAALGKVGDWNKVAAIASAHRVEGLVAQALASATNALPDGIAEYWTATGARIRRGALEQTGEILRIAAAMESGGIAYRFLKSIALGAAVYGTPTLKQSWDIDVLVFPEDAVRAAAALAELGYAPVKPPRPLTNAEFRRWSVVAKDAELRSPSGQVVELHWRLSDLPHLVTDIDVRTEARRVDLIGGRSVAIFADAPNLAYLAVHGAAAGWSRMKWLADFGALLNARYPAAREDLIRAARRYRTGRALDQALLLQSRLFGTDLSSQARSDATVERMVEAALVAIQRRAPEAEIADDPIALDAVRRSRSLLMPGLRYRAALALTRMRGIDDRAAVPLPAGLHWAYWFIRPATYGLRVARRLIGRAASSFR